ncbi:MAG TPA: addiction module protein [Armatimonadota bacterium]|jgi:putative addiction module component (TIGR02574 family)
MSSTAKSILESALALAPTERAEIAEGLLSSLDRPDPSIDALWAEEAERRIAAYDAGEVPAIPADQVFAEAERL